MSRYYAGPQALSEAIQKSVDAILELRRDNTAARAVKFDADKMAQDIQQCCLLLKQLETVSRKDPKVISDMGEYGLYLLQHLTDVTEQLGMRNVRQEMDLHMIAFGLWVARNGGQLRELEPLVNAFAAEANRCRKPADLQQLCGAMDEVITTVDRAHVALGPDLRAEPWRVLNINRGIVATRTRDPATMRRVFDQLIELLPKDAARFFSEGMEQMDDSDYPDEVREVMREYSHRYRDSRSLH